MLGAVDERVIEKYQKEAHEKGRDSWFLAFLLDLHEEERAKGKTQEVGRAHFSTENRRFTILDAPGHSGFVPAMISGAAQADVGVLIVSARKGEFETGFDRGGQTREHTLLSRTLGVDTLIVAVNKLDDATCNWSEDRFQEIKTKLTPFLRGCGYKNVPFVPISGYVGTNVKRGHGRTPAGSWYNETEPTLLEMLDGVAVPRRDPLGPLRIPLLEGYKDGGCTMVSGKVEGGSVTLGQSGVIMPGRMRIKITGVIVDENDVNVAGPGENIALRVTGVESDNVPRGTVLCNPESLCHAVTKVKVQLSVMELLEHRPVLSAGYGCVMHAHTAAEEVVIESIIESTNRTTKKRQAGPAFVRSNSVAVVIMQISQPTCLEPYAANAQLGRFTLRDEGRTIALGKVTEILD
eukprot:Polyplicarium_translucidae@DN1796_c0_g1_i1.p1